VNIFFDVDYTILSAHSTLRPRTKEVFGRLLDDGHLIYIWSGVGLRTQVIRDHELAPYVSGLFVKPLENYVAGLARFGVQPFPDFVIDDYPGIVEAFGGFYVNEFFSHSDEDRELEAVYDVIKEMTLEGHSTHKHWRPVAANTVLARARLEAEAALAAAEDLAPSEDME
jgi:hypothetical protein